jgi:hypothetical protein
VAQGRTEPLSIPDMSRKLWAARDFKAIMNERMLEDLRTIEKESQERLANIGALNAQKYKAGLSREEERELRRLEDTEAMRYWLREKLLRSVPIEKQREFDWLQPLGKGAFGVIPYTFITAWDMLPMDRRASTYWFADNQLLRWQTALVGQFLPRTPSMRWFRERAKHHFEKAFDDWNEELISDKKWMQMVKKGHAELEKMEEELVGYDQYTVSEERQIARLTSDYVKKMESLAREPLYYD